MVGRRRREAGGEMVKRGWWGDSGEMVKRG